MREHDVSNVSKIRRLLRHSGSALAALAVAAPLMLTSGCSQPQAAGFLGGPKKVEAVPTTGFDIGLAAYQAGQQDQAVDIWQRNAEAGDVRSKKALGDIYSGTPLFDETSAASDPCSAPAVAVSPSAAASANPASAKPVIQRDMVRALMWYTLAANHYFYDYQQPTACEVNARILAGLRLPDVRSVMKTSEVARAETLVSDEFQRGTAFDIYRLGLMYKSGSGVAKNDIKALTMFTVATKKGGVREAAAAAEAQQSLLGAKEIETALNDADNWQPPLPPEHTGPTKQMAELERLKKEIEELKTEDALNAISDIDVELIQRALRALGFYYGPVDNKMSKATHDAISRFQYSRVKRDTVMTPEEKHNAEIGVLSARDTVDLIRRAASDAEHPMSEYVYGVMNLRGIGVIQDGAAAVSWLDKAANQDLAIAHYALGVVYRDGTTGLNEVKPNKALAAQHFARAASLGSKDAEKALKALDFSPPRVKD